MPERTVTRRGKSTLRERVFLPAFLLVLVIGLAVIAYVDAPDAPDAHARLAAGITWLVAAGIGTGQQLVLARKGRLILRRAVDRDRARVTNRRWATTWAWALIGIAVALTAVLTGSAKSVLAAAFGGYLAAIAPVMLYIAFVVRPDEHIGEDL